MKIDILPIVKRSKKESTLSQTMQSYRGLASDYLEGRELNKEKEQPLKLILTSSSSTGIILHDVSGSAPRISTLPNSSSGPRVCYESYMLFLPKDVANPSFEQIKEAKKLQKEADLARERDNLVEE